MVTLWPEVTVPPLGENTGATTAVGGAETVKAVLVAALDSMPDFTAWVRTVVLAVMTRSTE